MVGVWVFDALVCVRTPRIVLPVCSHSEFCLLGYLSDDVTQLAKPAPSMLPKLTPPASATPLLNHTCKSEDRSRAVAWKRIVEDREYQLQSP